MRARFHILLTGMLLALACSYAQAATKTFTGATDNNFSLGTNWSPLGLPVAGDDLVIQTGATCNFDAGASNLAYGNLTIQMSGTLTWSAANTLNVVDVIDGAGGTLTLNNNGTLMVRGNFQNFGVGFSAAAGTTVHYAGSSAQTAPGYSYANLTINNSAGVTLGGAATVTGTLLIGNSTANSVLNDDGNQITSTGTLTIQNGSTLVLGGATGTTFPNFGTVSLNTGTTIEYAADVPQTVASRTDYRNLKLSGGGTKTFSTNPVTIQETFFVGVNCSAAAVSGSFSAVNVAGTGVITMGSANLAVSGNWTNTGGTTGGSGEVRFTGSNPSITGTTFDKVRFQNTGTANVTGTLTLNNSSTIDASSIVQVQNIAGAGTFAPSSGAILRVSGTYSLTNTVYANNVRVDYNGTGAQTIEIDDYADLEISQNRGTNMVTFAAGTLGITGNFFNNATFSGGGGFDVNAVTIDYKGTGAQTITSFKYKNLTISGARTTNNVTFSTPAPIGILGTFSITASFTTGRVVTTGSTIEYAGVGPQPVAATTPEFAYDTLLISGDTLLSGGITVKKDLVITATGVFDAGVETVFVSGNISVMGGLVPNGDFVLEGTALQTLSGTNPLQFFNLTVNNPAGVVLAANVEAQASLTLTAGRIITGTNKFGIEEVTTINGGSDASHIAGTCAMTFNQGGGIVAPRSVGSRAISHTVPVGDGVRFAPVVLTDVVVNVAGTVEVTVFPGDHPSIATSGLDANKSVNRHYRFAYTPTVNSGLSIDLPFTAADIDAAANAANLTARFFDGMAWSTPNLGTLTATSLRIANVNTAVNGEYQIAELFAGPPPTIKAIVASQNPVKAGVLLTLNADTDGMTFLWDFGDGSPTATTNPVTHTYNIEGTFNLTLTVTNPAGTAVGNVPVKVFAPASGGIGVKNVSEGDPPIVNPLNGLSVKVMSSEGGVIELFINVDALNRAAFDVSTDFDGVAGRQSTSTGTNPVTKVEKSGIIVATTKATDAGTTNERGKARKTIPVSRKETGETPLATTPPASTEINLSSMKGKFLFNKDTPDMVTFVGTIELPAGMDLSKEQEFSMGMGNVIDTVMVDTKGRAKDDGTLDRIKKLTIKYPKLPKGETLTTAGQKAKITISMSTANMDSIGFDTEGITNTLKSDEEGQKSVPRSIQVAMVIAGTSYEGNAAVQYKLSNKKDSGAMSGRSTSTQ
ncbi:MAG TPA: PKD domain-containing protein [Planctomycetota bacterium]|nr:PKD domain-containing protein [Planctomycetota bacterium]